MVQKSNLLKVLEYGFSLLVRFTFYFNTLNRSKKPIFRIFILHLIFILVIFVQMVQTAIGTKNNWPKFLESRCIAYFSGYLLLQY
jgi:hypothetical protein